MRSTRQAEGILQHYEIFKGGSEHTSTFRIHLIVGILQIKKTLSIQTKKPSMLNF